jgi:ABC-type lipoprotein release transport system permease subunit
MSISLATRNVMRNRWRSGLTTAGIAVSVAICIWFAHMMNAMLDEMVDSMTGSEIGDVQMTSEAYVEESNLFNALALRDVNLDAVRALPEVEAVSARLQAFGLIGDEKNSQVARILGVFPSDEAGVSKLSSTLKEGSWLSEETQVWPESAEVVLGKMLAKQLKVTVGDTLAIFTNGADGSLGNDKLVVKGIASTGSSALDRMGVWMHIERSQELAALDGRVHLVVVKGTRGTDVETLAAAVRGAAGAGVVTRTWRQVVPSLDAMIEVSKGSMGIIYFIIFLIAALGVLNTQRMSALERRREFGVLIAIGTTPMRLARMVMTEAVVLSAIGGLFGMLLGGLAVYNNQVNGLDFVAMQGGGGGEELNYMGVALGTFYFDLKLVDVFVPTGIMMIVGFVCGLWPAFTSSRTDAPSAIAGRS